MMRLVLLALLLVELAWAGDKNTNNGGVSIDFVGVSGKIKIYPTVDSSTFIAVAQSKLAELQQDGSDTSPKREINMANADMGWTDPTATMVGPGIMAYKTSFYNTASVGANTVLFVLNASFFVNTTTLPNGLVVTRNSLKFDISVSGWPTFLATTNYLSYELTVSAKGGDKGAKISDKQSNVKRIRFDSMLNGGIDLPTKAVINGVADTEITVNVVEKSNKDYIEFQFPGNNVVYDPVLTLDGSGAGHAAVSVALVALLCLLQVALRQ
jgi:hypothetical protein